MTYSAESLKNYSLKYLIEEGFIKVKLTRMSKTVANLTLDVCQIPDFPLRKEEMVKIAHDLEFINKYGEVFYE